MKKKHNSNVIGTILYDEESNQKMRKKIKHIVYKSIMFNSFFLTASILGLYISTIMPTESRLYFLLLGIGLLMFCLPSLFYLSFNYLKIYDHYIMIPLLTGHFGRILKAYNNNFVIDFHQIRAIYLNTKTPVWFGNKTEIFIILKNGKEIIVSKDYIYSIKKLAELLHEKVPLISDKAWVYKRGEYLLPPQTIKLHEKGFEMHYKEETLSIIWSNIEKMNLKSHPSFTLKNGDEIRIVAFHNSFNKHKIIAEKIKKHYRNQMIKWKGSVHRTP